MPLNYSFTLVCPATHLALAMEALADHLVPEQREWLRAARPWAPAFTYTHDGQSEPDQRHGIKGPGLAPREGHGRDYFSSGESFTFLFDRTADPALAAYDDQKHFQVYPQPTRAVADVGVVGVDVDVGERLAVVDATAVTSDMSRLFESSTSIRAAWIAMAERSGALGLFLDREMDDWELIFPASRMVPKPDEEAHVLADGIVRRVDSYYGAALVLAGLADRSGGAVPPHSV